MNILSLFFFSVSVWAQKAPPTKTLHPEVIIAGLAKVGSEILTTRDLQIHQFINEFDPLFKDYVEKNEALKFLVWETLMFSESKTLLNSPMATSEVKEAMSVFQKKYAKDDLWIKLKTNGKELEQSIERHLSAKKIMALKMPKDLISVTESEIESYYAQNRIQLGNKPLAEVYDKIKVGLKGAKSVERFNDWMLALTRTHSVEYYSGVQVH